VLRGPLALPRETVKMEPRETPGVTALEPRVAAWCTEVYGAHPIEIVDAYRVALAEETKTPVLATFNKKGLPPFPTP